jgi:hypothetical protein
MNQDIEEQLTRIEEALPILRGANALKSLPETAEIIITSAALNMLAAIHQIDIEE